MLLSIINRIRGLYRTISFCVDGDIYLDNEYPNVAYDYGIEELITNAEMYDFPDNLRLAILEWKYNLDKVISIIDSPRTNVAQKTDKLYSELRSAALKVTPLYEDYFNKMGITFAKRLK